MNDRERRAQRLLRVYPRAYRAARGDEMLATLAEASSHGHGTSTRDAIDIVIHGLQARLGLNADHFAGRVFKLAATPGISMAAALSLLMFVFNEWLPAVTHAPISLRFGPFWTIGPVVYMTWVLGATCAFLWPCRQRIFVTVSVVTTLAAIPVGDSLFARPNLWELLLLVGLGLPGMLAPSAESERPVRRASLGTGLATLVLIGLWQASSAPLGHSRWLPRTFWQGFELSHAMPWVAGAVFAVICVLLFTRHTDASGALAILLAPWLVIGATYPYRRSVANTIDLIALATLGAWLLAQWTFDLRKMATQDMESA